MKSIRQKAIVTALIIMLSAAGCGRAAPEAGVVSQGMIAVPDNATVSYLGQEGTYTQEVCGGFFKGKESYDT